MLLVEKILFYKRPHFRKAVLVVRGSKQEFIQVVVFLKTVGKNMAM